MTESTLYWITRLDQIHAFFDGLEFATGLLSVIGSIMYVVSYVIKAVNHQFNHENYIDNDFKAASDIINAIKVPLIFCICATFLISLTTTFLPTTQEMVAMKVIPQVATVETCEKMKGISKDFVDVAAKWLDSMKNTSKSESSKSE